MEPSDPRRLDSYLAKYWPEYSRSQWQKYLKLGYVKVNGQVQTINKTILGEDDEVSFDLPDKPSFDGKTLPVLYQDKDVIVIDKPAGVLTHAKGAMVQEFTVADFLGKLGTYNSSSNRQGIVHRLDRDTSGVIIGALNEAAAKMLQKQFSKRQVVKEYIAVVDGIPKKPKALIDLPIGRNPSAPSTFRVDPKGKTAYTEYEVLATNEKSALVKLHPLSGRTHQLRVHMNYIGAPIKGDKVYGKASDRLYLHAVSLTITLPSGEKRTFKSALPDEIKQLFPDIKL